MTVQELIDKLNDFPKEESIKFYVWDDIESDNVLMYFNSLKDDPKDPKCVNLYLE